METVTIGELFAAFGVPYYLKIDIEAYDPLRGSGLREIVPLPTYVSVENWRTGTLRCSCLPRLCRVQDF